MASRRAAPQPSSLCWPGTVFGSEHAKSVFEFRVLSFELRVSSPLRQKDVRHHHVWIAVRSTRRGLFEECAREHVRVAGGELQLRRERARDLNVELLTDV